nr:BRCA2-interacting transcriptional repressor EMSY isoform X1 [Megalopta genalis]
MWPTRHETMTRDECRKCLRYLELDAYGSMVSVLRAQGPFTNEKQKLLQELAKVLHISNERHRAEVRRAVNDEKLATIAEQLSGPNTGTDWTIEGRRAIPLLPRLKARTAFTTLANSLSLATAAANKRNLPLHEKTEDAKDITSKSPVKVKIEERILDDAEFSPIKDKFNEENIMEEVAEINKQNLNSESKDLDTGEKCGIVEKRKATSPLPTALPNKILVVSANSIGTLNHGVTPKGCLENTIQLSRVSTNSLQHQNFTIIPLNINCAEDSTDLEPKTTAVAENFVNHGAVSSSSPTNSVVPVEITSIAKTQGKLITTQSKLSTKIGSGILMPDGHNLQLETEDTSTQNSLSSSQKTIDSENSNSTASSTKRIVPMIHSNTKPPINKAITTNNSHRLITVCPGTAMSNGPGPPQPKQTTVTCKKIPTTLNNQIAAKIGVTLNSNKTVNISHHPNTKLASKTNVIVIQKGQTKGVTLSHAGKEVLGKVIVGGKNLCVTNQHSASINVLPRHITLNNGDQSVTMLSTTNLPQTEPIISNTKSGNTITFNLRQDVFEKNKALTQIFESPNVLTSESKTVIQNAHARLSKEPSNSDSHVQDNEIIVKTDAISSVKDEIHRSV